MIYVTKRKFQIKKMVAYRLLFATNTRIKPRTIINNWLKPFGDFLLFPASHNLSHGLFKTHYSTNNRFNGLYSIQKRANNNFVILHFYFFPTLSFNPYTFNLSFFSFLPVSFQEKGLGDEFPT